jgi:hypothetical protein
MYIFGENIQEIEQEWQELHLGPSYGSVKNDMLVRHWDEFFDPVTEFKKEGVYQDIKKLVHSRKVSGTFYLELAENEHYEHLQPGDKVDNRSRLTRWFVNLRGYDGYILKLICNDVPGLKIEDDGIILGECQLTVISRTDKLIEVQI